MKIIYFGDVVVESKDVIARDLYLSHAGILRSKNIVEMLVKCNTGTNILILSQALGNRRGFNNKIVIEPKDNQKFKQICLGYFGKGIIQRITSIISTTLWLLVNTNKEDIVIIYNYGPMTAMSVYISQIFRRFKIIIQFEELYWNFIKSRAFIFKICELKGIKMGNGFITPSSEIAITIRKKRMDNPPIAMSYGYFASEKLGSRTYKHPNENLKLTLLYSGTLDNNRGINILIGLMTFVEDIAELIITGTGDLNDYVKDMTDKSKNIRFLGNLSITDYQDIFESVDVCVNPTPKNTKFSLYTFPSKVVNYLSNGKIVLSTMIEPVINSPYYDIIVFFDETRPESFREKLIFIKRKLVSSENKNYEYLWRLNKIKKQEQRDINILLDEVIQS